MPNYLYSNPFNPDEVIEIFQKMEDEHIYRDDKGNLWNRIFTSPQTSVDTKINPYSAKDFASKTANKKGNLGSLWDISAELSEKRKDKEGIDSYQKAYYDRWSKKRKGKKHPKALSLGL